MKGSIGGPYREDSAVRGPCSGQRSEGGRARAARRGQYEEGAAREARDAPCRARRTTPAPTPPRGHSLRPGATPRGRGRLAAGAGAGAWHGGGVVCAPQPRLNSRARDAPQPGSRCPREPGPPPAARPPARRGPALPCPALPVSSGLYPPSRAPSASRRAFCTRRPSGSRATSTSPTTR